MRVWDKCRRATAGTKLIDVLGSVFGATLVLGTAVTLIIPGSRHALILFVDWARDNPGAGSVSFTLFFAAGAVLCWPEIMLAAVAGYIFPLWIATLAVWLGGLMGACVAFLLGRLCFSDRIRRCMSRRPRRAALLRSLDDAFMQHGWRVVLLIRLPYIPFVWMNYVLAATNVDLWRYSTATALGTLPGAAFYSYLGTGVKNLHGFVAGDEKPDSTTLALTVVGWLAAVATFCALGAHARRTLRAHGLEVGGTADSDADSAAHRMVTHDGAMDDQGSRPGQGHVLLGGGHSHSHSGVV